MCPKTVSVPRKNSQCAPGRPGARIGWSIVLQRGNSQSCRNAASRGMAAMSLGLSRLLHGLARKVRVRPQDVVRVDEGDHQEPGGPLRPERRGVRSQPAHSLGRDHPVDGVALVPAAGDLAEGLPGVEAVPLERRAVVHRRAGVHGVAVELELPVVGRRVAEPLHRRAHRDSLGGHAGRPAEHHLVLDPGDLGRESGEHHAARGGADGGRDVVPSEGDAPARQRVEGGLCVSASLQDLVGALVAGDEQDVVLALPGRGRRGGERGDRQQRRGEEGEERSGHGFVSVCCGS